MPPEITKPAADAAKADTAKPAADAAKKAAPAAPARKIYPDAWLMPEDDFVFAHAGVTINLRRGVKLFAHSDLHTALREAGAPLPPFKD